MFSLPKGTPKVHQAGLKNWQPAVAPYQKSCETTHGLIIFFIIDTIATGQRSPAGPRRLGTATRISASLFRRLSAFFGSTPDQAPKAAKLAVLIPGPGMLVNVRNAPRVVIPPPSETPPCFAVCALVCDLSPKAECVPAFACESKRGPFVREVEKRDERWSEIELLLIVGGHREPGNVCI